MTPTMLPEAPPRRPAAGHAKTGPIVVAVGDSDAASVVRAANVLALESDAGVLAVSVLEPLPVYVTGSELSVIPPSFEEDRRTALFQQLKDQVEQVVGQNADWRIRVIYGYAGRALADLAAAEKAPLIVMGIGRHRPIDRLLGGETALRTIRRATCPVLAVGPGLDAPPHTVVVATDFSAASARAAEQVVPLLAPGATIHFLHVWEPIDIKDARTEALDASYRQALPERFRRLTSALDIPPNVTVKLESREGKTVPRILDFAQAHYADLIVAGRHGTGLLERVLVGSVTTSLLRRAMCSLFVAPEPPFAEIDRLQRRIAGMSESRRPEQWEVQLDEFTRRNAGRRTALEFNDPVLGAEAHATGYAFVGAAYDRHDGRLELMFSHPEGGMKHLTRGITDVESVVVLTDARGIDMGLRIYHLDGHTLVTFLSA